jgi:hypothetical protein
MSAAQVLYGPGKYYHQLAWGRVTLAKCGKRLPLSRYKSIPRAELDAGGVFVPCPRCFPSDREPQP